LLVTLLLYIYIELGKNAKDNFMQILKRILYHKGIVLIWINRGYSRCGMNVRLSILFVCFSTKVV